MPLAVEMETRRRKQRAESSVEALNWAVNDGRPGSHACRAVICAETSQRQLMSVVGGHDTATTTHRVHIATNQPATVVSEL